MKSALWSLVLIVGFTAGINSLAGSAIESVKAQSDARHEQIEQQIQAQ